MKIIAGLVLTVLAMAQVPGQLAFAPPQRSIQRPGLAVPQFTAPPVRPAATMGPRAALLSQGLAVRPGPAPVVVEKAPVVEEKKKTPPAYNWEKEWRFEAEKRMLDGQSIQTAAIFGTQAEQAEARRNSYLLQAQGRRAIGEIAERKIRDHIRENPDKADPEFLYVQGLVSDEWEAFGNSRLMEGIEGNSYQAPGSMAGMFYIKSTSAAQERSEHSREKAMKKLMADKEMDRRDKMLQMDLLDLDLKYTSDTANAALMFFLGRRDLGNLLLYTGAAAADERAAYLADKARKAYYEKPSKEAMLAVEKAEAYANAMNTFRSIRMTSIAVPTAPPAFFPLMFQRVHENFFNLADLSLAEVYGTYMP